MFREPLFGLILLSLLFCSESTDPIKFEVFEELEAGTFVGDISQHPIVKSYEVFKGPLRFQFQGLVPQSSFGINETTGVIRTERKLDRENLSLYDDTFQIQVKVSKGKLTAAIPTEIKVLDTNDNSPTFKETVEHISVSESAPLGAELPITVADDKDIGNYTVQSYEIVSRNDGGIFQLKISRPTVELTKVKLVVSRRLDREKNDSFYLVIEARDGGNPSRVGRKGLNITVLDSNDHIPKFSKDLYVGEVRENSREGTFILQVSASDGDIGTNAEIVYSLKPRRQYENLFILDAQTGELRTNEVLDYELSKNYQLEVTAKDKGPDSIPSTAVINVKVLDENDNSPEITVTSLTEAFDQQGRVPEDTPLNTGVAIVTVRDKDSGRNGRVTVTLRHSKQDFGLKEMFAGQYILEIRRPLSLDRHAQYNIKIVAEDQGLPMPRQSNHVFNVKLADSNRHAPVFEQKVYNKGISDDVTAGTAITRVRAVDRDDGRNAELTYSLESMRIGARNGSEEDKTKWFAIDSRTGIVLVKSKLWCKFTPSFVLNIDVKDNGRVPFHGKTTINIAVHCSKHVYNFSVAENEPAGIEVGRIPFSSIAPDRPLRARLVPYASQDFALDNKTGVITTKRGLDRENVDSYPLTVILSDGNVEVELVVIVNVVDMNDNAPVFVGFQSQHYMTLTNAVPRGAEILKVKAVDKDSGSNGLVKYAIVSGNDDHVFRINNRNGRITLLKQLNNKSYNLLIRASDSGSIEEKSFLRLEISVRFITPAPPVTGIPGKSSSRPGTTNKDDGKDKGVVDSRKDEGGFFADTKMIIIIAVCAGFLLLSIILTVVFCMRCRRKSRKKAEEGDKRGSYHEPDISREDALKASKKMFHQATANRRESPEVLTYGTRQKPINVSPIPIKKMHPMTYQAPGTGSPTGPVRADMYYPVDQAVVPECYTSDEELDSGRGGSSRGSSPYCPHSPSSKKREDDWRPPQHVKYNAPVPYRACSPGLPPPPPPPPYEEVQRRKAFVTISGVTHSTTEL